MKILLILIACFAFTGCEAMRFVGAIQSDYGTVSSDGKTITVLVNGQTKKVPRVR